VDRSQIEELHYITPIQNIHSILRIGILSHNKSKRLRPATIAMQEIQDIRSKVSIPGGLPLHDYANLYFTARNPMLYKRHKMHADLAVLRISLEVLDIEGVVITDGNASSEYTAFWPPPDGLRYLDYDLVFARYWTNHDDVRRWKKKRAKCAEVLVPQAIQPNYIFGAYASCSASLRLITSTNKSLTVIVNPDLFFLS